MSLKSISQRDVMYVSLLISVVLYILMFILLKTSYKVYDSDFFYITVDTTNIAYNPVILGIHLETTAQFVGLCVFFAINAFLGVWNSVLIDGVFGMMVYDEGEDIIRKIKKHYGGETSLMWLFMVYDVWRSARIFFSIIGMYSNVAFFLCTAGGGLVAGVLTKQIFLSRENLHLLKADLRDEEVPLAQAVPEDYENCIKLQTNLFIIKKE